MLNAKAASCSCCLFICLLLCHCGEPPTSTADNEPPRVYTIVDVTGANTNNHISVIIKIEHPDGNDFNWYALDLESSDAKKQQSAILPDTLWTFVAGWPRDNPIILFVDPQDGLYSATDNIISHEIAMSNLVFATANTSGDYILLHYVEYDDLSKWCSFLRKGAFGYSFLGEPIQLCSLGDTSWHGNNTVHLRTADGAVSRVQISETGDHIDFMELDRADCPGSYYGTLGDSIVSINEFDDLIIGDTYHKNIDTAFGVFVLQDLVVIAHDRKWAVYDTTGHLGTQCLDGIESVSQIIPIPSSNTLLTLSNTESGLRLMAIDILLINNRVELAPIAVYNISD